MKEPGSCNYPSLILFRGEWSRSTLEVRTRGARVPQGCPPISCKDKTFFALYSRALVRERKGRLSSEDEDERLPVSSQLLGQPRADDSHCTKIFLVRLNQPPLEACFQLPFRKGGRQARIEYRKHTTRSAFGIMDVSG